MVYPRSFTGDNGSAFSSKQLTLACARLGVALVHSKPYDSPSRGKIERWFRTLRQGFLSLLDLEALTLDDLNARLSQWLEQDYHRRRHSSICETPLERYLRSARLHSPPYGQPGRVGPGLLPHVAPHRPQRLHRLHRPPALGSAAPIHWPAHRDPPSRRTSQ